MIVLFWAICASCLLGNVHAGRQLDWADILLAVFIAPFVLADAFGKWLHGAGFRLEDEGGR